VITATDLELRAGSRILLSGANLRVQPGDRIGLVGRNGAGKTTSMRVLAGEGEPYAGAISSNSAIGYLPQDPREGDLSVTAKDRVLSAKGLDDLLRRMEKIQSALAELVDDAQNEKAVREYGRIEERFSALGGYAASDGGAQSATSLLLDEPTNHLDADSITWLRSFLSSHEGGLVVISHDTDLLAAVVNKVWFLDATRGEVDVYNMDWKRYLEARATDEKRRRRERANAEKKASALHTQALKMGAKATKAVAAKNMARRADELLAGLEPERKNDRVARIRFPDPAPCGRTPLTAEGLSKAFGSLEVFTGVDLAVDRGAKVVVLGLNGAGKTTLLRLLAGTEEPDTGEVLAGHGLRTGYFAQEHDTLDMSATVWENVRHASPDTPEQQLRTVLGTFMFSGEQLEQQAGTLSGGERTRLALAGLVSSSANVLLLDEPTNNLDPASREQVLDALRRFSGAVVLVTHDPGAVEALHPDKVIVLPDGTEDHWSPDYLDLVQLA
jgi:ATPase subunit of ABC transporter with duplicated ATPase domains